MYLLFPCSVTYRDSGCNSKMAIGSAFELLEDPDTYPDLFLGPVCSSGTWTSVHNSGQIKLIFWFSDIFFFQTGAGGTFFFIFRGFKKLRRAADFFFLVWCQFTHVRRQDIRTQFSRNYYTVITVCVLYCWWKWLKTSCHDWDWHKNWNKPHWCRRRTKLPVWLGGIVEFQMSSNFRH